VSTLDAHNDIAPPHRLTLDVSTLDAHNDDIAPPPPLYQVAREGQMSAITSLHTMNQIVFQVSRQQSLANPLSSSAAVSITTSNAGGSVNTSNGGGCVTNHAEATTTATSTTTTPTTASSESKVTEPEMTTTMTMVSQGPVQHSSDSIRRRRSSQKSIGSRVSCDALGGRV
jgi:hypothetical protein